MKIANNDVGLAEISALLAALGIVIYILGMIALCWPIYRRITRDATVALHAVSLMPNRVVIGQGVRLLFGLPLFVTLVWGSLSIIQRILNKAMDRVVDHFFEGLTGNIISVILAIVIFGMYVVALLVVLRRSSSITDALEVRGISARANTLAVVSSIVAGLGTALLLIGRAFFETGAVLPHVASWSFVLKAAAFIILLNCVTAFILAFAGEPPLPEIALNGATTPDGKLVAHAEGVWYLLDKNGMLVGVPDDKVGRILVFPP